MSLPSGYTQLEYIQSSGTQYIDTGFKPNQDAKIVISMAFLGSAGENVLGSRNSSSDANNRFGIITFGSSSKIGSFFGSTATQSISLDSSIHNYTLSKAGLSVDGVSYGGAYTASFSCTYPITLFAWNNGSNGIVKNSSKIVDCKIFSGEVLVRNFIPCKNPSGVIGLYDVIENKFYKNAGTGSFVAGAEVKGSHKTLIDGTWYDLNAGKCLVGGTAYSVKKGRVLVNSTGYDIPFSSGIPLSTVALGDILMLNENGNPVPFYVCKHDYESGLNGAGRTLVVRKDCYDMRRFSYSNNAYANSSLDSWLCNTYLKLLDADIQAAIGTTKFYYTPGNGNTTVTTLQRAVFQLSLTELGKSASDANTEGSALPIARTLQIAYRNGSAVVQWTRTPHAKLISRVFCLGTNGSVSSLYYYDSYGSRPAFTLPSTTAVTVNPDGTYSPAE